MTALMTAFQTRPIRSFAILAARVVLGVLFIRMGLHKALNPADFLKTIHEYGWFERSVVLTWIAALLPWFEVFCGILLVVGLRVRGTAIVILGMLIFFSALVLQRALHLHETSGMPFCAIRFDCGCGNGEVVICRKLVENLLLMGLSLVSLLGRRPSA